jgi:hypothetical protein
MEEQQKWIVGRSPQRVLLLLLLEPVIQLTQQHWKKAPQQR